MPIAIKDWQAEVARVTGVEQLPTEWYGYEGVDRVVLLTVSPRSIGNCQAERLEALERWVRLGGRLLLSLGAPGGGPAGAGGAAGPLRAGQIRADDAAAPDQRAGDICRHRASGSIGRAGASRFGSTCPSWSTCAAGSRPTKATIPAICRWSCGRRLDWAK